MSKLTIIQHNNKFYTLWEEVNVILQSTQQLQVSNIIPPKIKVQQEAMREYFGNDNKIFDSCDKLIWSFIMYNLDSYWDWCAIFPSEGLSFRHEYLRVWNMREWHYNNGANDYKEYSWDQLINTMPSTEKRACIFKNTIDTKKPAFIKAIDADCYAKWYTRQKKSQIDKILKALADKLGLSYDSATTSDQAVVKAYMYLKWALGWERMNTDWNSWKDWDDYWKVDNTNISLRAILYCTHASQRISRIDNDDNDCSVALVKEI